MVILRKKISQRKESTMSGGESEPQIVVNFNNTPQEVSEDVDGHDSIREGIEELEEMSK